MSDFQTSIQLTFLFQQISSKQHHSDGLKSSLQWIIHSAETVSASPSISFTLDQKIMCCMWFECW